MRTALAAAITCFTLAGVTMAGDVQAARRHTNISEQPLGDALRALAQDRGLQLVYLSDSVESLRTAGAVGEFTAEEVLKRLLSGTGLAYRYVDEKTVTIFPARPSSGEQGGPEAADQKAEQPAQPEKRTELEEVVVTGTNIRGAPSTSPVIAFSSEDLQQSGYGTIQEFVEAIPQNFGGGADGASDDGLLGQGMFRLLNRTAATAVNLRGLGGAGTLVLVNGHRVAPTQLGRSVDISQFPISAIERIEIVPDGSSAIYGSDAIAGVMNVILKRDYEGADTLVRHDFTTEGGRDDTTVSQSAGTNWSTGGVMGSVQYQKQTPLSADERSFASLLPRPHHLLPGNEGYNGALSMRQQLGSTMEAYLDALYTQRDGFRRNTAATEQIRHVDYSAEGYSIAGGLTVGFARGWQVEISGLYGEQADDSMERRLSLAGETRIDIGNSEFELYSADVIVRGGLGERVRSPKLAFGGSFRGERLHQYVNALSGASLTDRAQERDVVAGFAEVLQPLIVAGDAIPFVRSLAITGAIRYDDYSDWGSTTNYRAGAVWEPAEHLKLRTNYSTSFRAPGLFDQFDRTRPADLTTRVAVAPSGSGTVTILSQTGGGWLLGPESADSFSVGLDFDPPWIRNLSLGLSYYEVDYRDRIIRPSFNAQMIVQSDVYRDLITTFANDAEVQAYVDRIVSVPGGDFDDPLGGGTAGIRYLVDLRLQNIAILNQSGFDIFARYSRPLGPGILTARANASITNHIRTRFSRSAAAVDVVDTVDNPIAHRYRVNLAWSGEVGSLALAINHAGEYTNNVLAVPESIDAWTTIDLVGRASLRWLAGRSGIDDFTLGVTVKNLFDKDPPYIRQFGARTVNYDVANANPENRVVGLEMRAQW